MLPLLDPVFYRVKVNTNPPAWPRRSAVFRKQYFARQGDLSSGKIDSHRITSPSRPAFLRIAAPWAAYHNMREAGLAAGGRRKAPILPLPPPGKTRSPRGRLPPLWKLMAQGPEINSDIVIPLHVERIEVGKKKVAKGKVRISIVTREREELIRDLHKKQEVEIERRPVGREVDHAPTVYQTGDTVIIPVVEEVFTMVRRLVVKEEIRIRYVNKREESKQRVTVRRQEAVIDRLPANGEAEARPALSNRKHEPATPQYQAGGDR